MALVIGLVAAAARALASDNNGSGQNYNNGYNSNGYTRGYNNNYSSNHAASHVPFAEYGTCSHMTSRDRATRRMERRMRKAERKAERNEMIMSLMSSGSRRAPSQPVSGVSYTNYGQGPAPRGVYSEAQGSVAGSYRDRMPSGAPEGYRWRDEQSRDRSRDLGSSGAGPSMDGLPSYEQAVQKPRKS
ncbi:hypothetical protein MKX08_008568 [Trichoderma sp. CBMAI-0020]|nr:hypothetical protein MKX08_008568 [Trichoderma sp. CBMAI-0020]